MNLSIKTTINISAQLKNELNKYVKQNLISSFSSGVNEAIALYIKELQKKNMIYKPSITLIK
jgi:metal-responsive CopG/Arc/MetJ family transcriptional regulator